MREFYMADHRMAYTILTHKYISDIEIDKARREMMRAAEKTFMKELGSNQFIIVFNEDGNDWYRKEVEIV